MRRFRLTPLRLAAAVLVGVVACTGVAYAATLGVSSGKLFAWGQPLTKASCNQTASTGDTTYVQQQHATSNVGNPTTFLVQGSSSSKSVYGFVRFDIGGCAVPTTGGADDAKLTLFVTSASTDTISLYPVYSSWSSSTLTWNLASGLTVGTSPTTSFTATAGSHTVTVVADVDSAIKAGALWGWELRDTSGTGSASIAATTNGTTANRPSMTLTYEK